MLYLVDTDVLGKKDGPNGTNIRHWLAGIDDNLLAISAFTIFEIAKGIQRKRDAGDGELADVLQAGLERVKTGYAGRILPLDTELADRWGQMAGADARQWIDRGLLATAKVHGLIVATCNIRDMKGRGVEIVGPERDPPGRWAPDGTPIAGMKP